MFYGNLALLLSLILSWGFDLVSVWKLSWMIRSRSKEISAQYSGWAAFFSVAGITTWFVFAWLAVEFLDTMSFGVWLLISTSLMQFFCYLHNRYYVRMFNDSAFYRQVLGTDELNSNMTPSVETI